MRSNVWHHITSGLISCFILAGGVAGVYLLNYKPKAPAAEPTAIQPPLVETVALKRHEGTLDISVDGTVVPFREISTSAEVAGRVVFKAAECDAGRFVTKGTLLLKIDPQDYEFEIKRLTSQLDEADASIEELEVEIVSTGTLLELAQEDLAIQQRELERMTKLAASNVVTASDLDRTKQTELTARNALAVLRNQEHLQKTRRNRTAASRKLVETQLAKANLDKDRTEIFAATDGVVVEEFVEEGDYVQKGSSLITLEDTSAVEVKCSLQMDDLYWLWRSQSHDASGSGQPGGRYEIPQAPVTVSYQLPQSDIRYHWNGRLSRFDGIGLDEMTRTVPCRVLVEDPLNVTLSSTDQTSEFGPPALVRGMYVDVKIKVAQAGDLLQIPDHLVRPGKALWVVRDGQLRVIKPLRLIALAIEDGPTPYWIADAASSNLMPDDVAIITPLTAVTDGMPIRLGESP